MPIMRSLKPIEPIPHVEVDVSDFPAVVRTRDELINMLRRDVEIYREPAGERETSLHFEWHKKTITVTQWCLVILLNEFELLLIEPGDPPRGSLEVDLGHPLLRNNYVIKEFYGRGE